MDQPLDSDSSPAIAPRTPVNLVFIAVRKPQKKLVNQTRGKPITDILNREVATQRLVTEHLLSARVIDRKDRAGRKNGARLSHRNNVRHKRGY